MTFDKFFLKFCLAFIIRRTQKGGSKSRKRLWTIPVIREGGMLTKNQGGSVCGKQSDFACI